MGTNARRRRTLVRQALFLVGLALVAMLGWQRFEIYYQRKGLLAARFIGVDGRSTPQYYLRLANTEAERRQGLMYEPAENLSNRRGMLFVFPKEAEHSFWMKNTPTSLDMIFIDSKMTVVGVLQQVPPFSLEGRSVGVASQYVVELLAGTAARDGIVTGSRFESTSLNLAR